MKNKIIAVLILSILILPGCESEYLTNTWNSVFTEATEAYENVKAEFEEKSEKVQDKIDKINQAAEDVGEATTAVGEAIDSLQAIGDPLEEESGTGEVEE